MEVSGNIIAERETDLSSSITAKVKKINFRVSSFVKEGDVLIELDSHNLTAQLITAKAQEKLAQLRYNQVKKQLDAEMDIALKLNLNVNSAVGKQLRDEVEIRKIELQLARASVASQSIAIEDTLIRAPFSGKITQKSIEIGEIVSPINLNNQFTRSPIGKLVDMKSLKIEVDIAEELTSKIEIGTPALIKFDAVAKNFNGLVVSMSPVVDPVKGSITTRIELTDPLPLNVLIGMSARVTFLNNKTLGPSEKNRVLIPIQAVRKDQVGRTHVLIVKLGIAKRVNITIEKNLNENMIATSDLKGSEILILTENVVEGSKVTTLK